MEIIKEKEALKSKIATLKNLIEELMNNEIDEQELQYHIQVRY